MVFNLLFRDRTSATVKKIEELNRHEIGDLRVRVNEIKRILDSLLWELREDKKILILIGWSII